MISKRIIFLILFCMPLLIGSGCKKQPQQKADQKTPQAVENNRDSNSQPSPNNVSASAPAPASKPKMTLRQIAEKARTWAPTFTRLYGLDAPDFTVTDLNGKKHTLSEYKGKNVMLIFWATWCGPCIAEIPHLIELREKTGEDKLVMLAVSYVDRRNTVDRIKSFVNGNRVINYPVIPANQTDMPTPYIYVNSIPCSFFINPQGKIKLATEGLIPISQMKAIIEAEE